MYTDKESCCRIYPSALVVPSPFVTVGTRDLIVVSSLAPFAARAGALENSLMHNDWRASIVLKLLSKYCDVLDLYDWLNPISASDENRIHVTPVLG